MHLSEGFTAEYNYGICYIDSYKPGKGRFSYTPHALLFGDFLYTPRVKLYRKFLLHDPCSFRRGISLTRHVLYYVGRFSYTSHALMPFYVGSFFHTPHAMLYLSLIHI